MSYREKVKDLYDTMLGGKLLDAFDKYYHEDCEMQENSQAPRKGKAENRKYEEQFLANVKEWHDGGYTAIASDEENGITMVESWIDVTFGDGNRVKMEEVAVQHWEGDFIVKERFYHNMGGGSN